MASPVRGSSPDSTLISDITAVRDEWLEHGLCTRPSDRLSAEDGVTQLYQVAGFRRPEFVWMPSPPAGLDLITSAGLSTTVSLAGDGMLRASARIAAKLAESRSRMDRRVARPSSGRWRFGSPRDFSPEGVLIRAELWDSLHTSFFDGVATALRTLLPPMSGGVTWYGQQESHRIAFYDAYRRLGLAGFRRDDHELLDALTTVTASTGWWWAFDEVCVMVERPRVLCTEPTPGGVHGERRLHCDDDPAIEFIDGQAVFVHHGTIVPEWVVKDPSVERISGERNVEIRRCAIERIGWDEYIDAAGLELVDRVDDPGNPGCALGLYAMPAGWGRPGRILLVTNGSLERDGHRRRYGLHVPQWMPSALNAAGWTYGISGADYARLVRRT